MARLGMLYAITDNELVLLKKQSKNDMYEFMLENIEEKYFSTPMAYELDKAWEGIHLCIHDGDWVEENSAKSEVIFSGSFLLDTDDYVITLKNDIKEIIQYLNSIDLGEVIKKGVQKINPSNYSLPLDENTLPYLLGWSEGIKSFYENANNENLNVIFTVDL